jgi:SAM-dependent methyltransferase
VLKNILRKNIGNSLIIYYNLFELIIMSTSVNENASVYYKGKYWNDYPECLAIINTRLFGEDMDWKQYLINNNLKNFEHALILNCGNGWVERELYDCGIILKATSVEYNTALINECNQKKENRDITYVQHDVNTINFSDSTFDLVINFAACHHIRYIEKVCNSIRLWLKPDGYFIHNDYIGPQRNQYNQRQWKRVNKVNNMLHYSIKKSIGYPDVMQMMIDDATEAINANRIAQVVYDFFNIDYHSKSGGVIAYELLTHNDKLFNLDIKTRKDIVKKIMKYDMKYMKKTGESFFHFIIARNNKAVSKEIINNKLKCMNIREELADRTFGHYSYNVLKINEMINCNEHNSYGKSFFVHGFFNIESIGRWSIGDTSIIRFKCEDIGNKNLLINVNSMEDHNQKFSIEINEIKTMNFDIESEQTLELPLIQNKDYPDEVVIIFKYHDVKTPKELGINNDARELALFFKWIKLV